ncbi:hypothetical protein R1flu_019307 [Riccia fluitans]|uniref:Uncharacterized protein n=1 Tax=Riccia fluitans TaxID=41844 RepID=A0ABD1ZIA7_9MARC
MMTEEEPAGREEVGNGLFGKIALPDRKSHLEPSPYVLLAPDILASIRLGALVSVDLFWWIRYNRSKAKISSWLVFGGRSSSSHWEIVSSSLILGFLRREYHGN